MTRIRPQFRKGCQGTELRLARQRVCLMNLSNCLICALCVIRGWPGLLSGVGHLDFGNCPTSCPRMYLASIGTPSPFDLTTDNTDDTDKASISERLSGNRAQTSEAASLFDESVKLSYLCSLCHPWLAWSSFRSRSVWILETVRPAARECTWRQSVPLAPLI